MAIPYLVIAHLFGDNSPLKMMMYSFLKKGMYEILHNFLN